MKRFVLGVLVGMILASLAATAATDKKDYQPVSLTLWTGEGARPGLYKDQRFGMGKTGEEVFYYCKLIGPAKITPPPLPKP